MTRTFIYGSCVSRDTFEYLRADGKFSLVEYVARQSLLSVYTAASRDRFPAVDHSSAFQRRMVDGDVRSSLAPLLRAQHRNIDLLLWDLCDERLGVWRLPSGHFITRSVDNEGTALGDYLAEEAELIPLGDPRHLRWWTWRAKQFGAMLTELGLRERLVLLAPDWAEACTDGSAPPTSFGLSAPEANAIYRDYISAVETHVGCPIVSLSAHDVACDAEHQWGPAPFHYSRGTYDRLVQQLQALRVSDN